MTFFRLKNTEKWLQLNLEFGLNGSCLVKKTLKYSNISKSLLFSVRSSVRTCLGGSVP